MASDMVLYLLMRTDMESMNPGKACAQAHHAGTALANKIIMALDEDWQTDYDEWLKQATNFGTVITLGVNEEQLFAVLKLANDRDNIADFIMDPTYPIKDGLVTHLVPVITCGYVLCERGEGKYLMGHLELMK